MHPITRWLSCCSLLIATAGSVASDTFAAEPASGRASKSVQDEARDRLRLGVKAYKDGRHREAIDHFLVANRLVPSPSLSFNIAKAYERLGDDSLALMWYRDYVRQSPAAEDRADLDKLIHALELKLRDKGVQQVTVLSIPNGATVVMDGQPVGVTPWTGDVAPRKHTLKLLRTGYREALRQFELAEDRAMDVAVALEDASAPVAVTPTASSPVASVSVQPPRPDAPPPTANAAASSAPAQQSSLRIATTTWITFGVGAAALVGALGFEFARRSAEADARSAPTQLGARDSYDTMQGRQTAARVLLGVGAATTLAAGVLLVFDLKRDRASASSGVETARLVSIGCGQAGCGMAATGSF